MKKIFARRLMSVLCLAAMLAATIPAFAEGEAKMPYIHLIAYHNEADILIGARNIKGALSNDEVDALADVYEADGTARAKVFEWTKELDPIREDSGRVIDMRATPTL